MVGVAVALPTRVKALAHLKKMNINLVPAKGMFQANAAAGKGESNPQGLKPSSFCGTCGTTEVVP
jgi:hypothetical protein